MSALDRDSPPRIPPSSNPLSSQSRTPLVIPVLRRVNRNAPLGGTANGAEVNHEALVEDTHIFTVTLPLRGMANDTSATSSTLASRVENSSMSVSDYYPEAHLLSTDSASGGDIPSPQPELETKPSSPAKGKPPYLPPESDREIPTFSSPALPKPDRPGIPHSNPPSPEPEPQQNLSTTPRAHSVSQQQQQRPKASPLWTARSDKCVSVERKRQARSTEDERLVEDARKRAAGLLHRSRQARMEDKNHNERTLKHNEETVCEMRQIDKRVATRASATKSSSPSKSLSSDKPAFHVDRGRTLERVVSNRRNLGLTDSPKPHGVKRSSATAAKAIAPNSAKIVTPAVPGHVRVTPRTTRGAAKPTAVSRANAVTLPKQPPVVTLGEARIVRPRPGVESMRKGHAEKNMQRQKRSEAPSPEQFSIPHTRQESLLELDASLGKQSSVHGSESVVYHAVRSPDLPNNSRELAKTAAVMGEIDCLSRGESAAWAPPVHCPKARSDPGPASMPSLHDDEIEKQRMEFSLASTSNEEEAEVWSRTSVFGSEDTVYRQEVTSDAVTDALSVGPSLVPLGNPVAFASGHEECEAEIMSPVDLSKVSALRLPITAEATTAESVEARRHSAPEPSENISDAESQKDQSHVEPKGAYLIEPHSEAGPPEVEFDGTLPLGPNSLALRPDATSPVCGKSPVRDRTKWGAKFKRKGINDVHWHADLSAGMKESLGCVPKASRREANNYSDDKSASEDFFAHNSSDAGVNLSDPSSYPELQQSKYPLSCLTVSHRRRKLNVSFASEAESNKPIKSTSTDADFKEGEEPPRLSHVTLEPASHNHDVTHPYASSTSGNANDECTNFGTRPAETIEGYRVYTKEDYDKVEKGVRKAAADARLLLRVSYPPPSRPADLPDHVVEIVQLLDALDFVKAVKRHFLYQPEIYYKFKSLLASIEHKSVADLTDNLAKYIDAEVAKLFADAPDLLKGYERFRPPGKISASETSSRTAKEGAEFIDDALQGRMEIERLVRSLRKSAEVQEQRPGYNKPEFKSEGSMRSAKFNPTVPEFKPLFLPIGTVHPVQPATPPQFSSVHATGLSTYNNNYQFRGHGPGKSSAPVFAPANASRAMQAMGYHSMPTRLTNRPNTDFESLKDLAAAEDPRAIVLPKPLTMNGTTYYTMPKRGVLATGTATCLPSGPRNNARKDCRIAFSKPASATYGGNSRSLPRGAAFVRDNNTNPLWMYTPLVPIRKSNDSEKMMRKTADAEEHGMEAEKLEESIAKMKLDEFTSRFPMTGRKSQVIPNMKQKYAAEIQHRLELVLYEKKEKEAAAAKKMKGLMGQPAPSNMPSPAVVLEPSLEHTPENKYEYRAECADMEMVEG